MSQLQDEINVGDNLLVTRPNGCQKDKRLDEWVPRHRISIPASMEKNFSTSTINLEDETVRCTRNSMRKMTDTGNSEIELGSLEREHQEFTRVKFIDQIQLGQYEIDTWYFSPYPDEFKHCTKLWICEFCLKYMKHTKTWVNHVTRNCKHRCPPGQLIYRKANACVFEIDGQVHKLYCQNLCLVAKLFLDHKTLYYDVAPFMFYVLCEVDRDGTCHLMGYFSKEKVSADNYNLACILTLPPYQRQGIGRFLISLSYQLAKIVGLIGSPEKPLSDLGRLSYRSYWQDVLYPLLLANSKITVEELSQTTCIAVDDILWTLQSDTGIDQVHCDSVLHVDHRLIASRLHDDSRRSCKRRSTNAYYLFDPSCLHWSPNKVS